MSPVSPASYNNSLTPEELPANIWGQLAMSIRCVVSTWGHDTSWSNSNSCPILSARILHSYSIDILIASLLVKKPCFSPSNTISMDWFKGIFIGLSPMIFMGKCMVSYVSCRFPEKTHWHRHVLLHFSYPFSHTNIWGCFSKKNPTKTNPPIYHLLSRIFHKPCNRWVLPLMETHMSQCSTIDPHPCTSQSRASRGAGHAEPSPQRPCLVSYGRFDHSPGVWGSVLKAIILLGLFVIDLYIYGYLYRWIYIYIIIYTCSVLSFASNNILTHFLRIHQRVGDFMWLRPVSETDPTRIQPSQLTVKNRPMWWQQS